MELSAEMKRAVEWAHQHGCKIHRHAGGYWGHEKFMEHYGPWFSTPTMQAIVKRGVAEYSKWQEGKNGRFPVEVTLKCVL